MGIYVDINQLCKCLFFCMLDELKYNVLLYIRYLPR